VDTQYLLEVKTDLKHLLSSREKGVSIREISSFLLLEVTFENTELGVIV
jgi:hypothetical protein